MGKATFLSFVTPLLALVYAVLCVYRFMEMETSRFLLGMLFLVVGITLFAIAIVLKLKMEKEVEGGGAVLQNSFLPYWNADKFTDKGNTFRKAYNFVYFVLLVYSSALMIFMKSGG